MGFPPGCRFAVRCAHPGAMTGDHPRRDRSRRASLPWWFPVGRETGTRSHLHMASARLSYLTSTRLSETKRMRRYLLDALGRGRDCSAQTRRLRSLSTGSFHLTALSTTDAGRVDRRTTASHADVMFSAFPNHSRFSAHFLIVSFVSTLLIVATPPGVAAQHRERWQWPTGGPVAIVERFAPPAHDWLSGRRGVTLQYPAPSPVYACAPGTVTTAGPVAGRGVIAIRHDVGGRIVWSTYLPVTPSVAVGDRVEKGDVIGVVEGDSPTLHWGAKTGRRTYINPIRMTLGHPRLLPWDDAPAQ